MALTEHAASASSTPERPASAAPSGPGHRHRLDPVHALPDPADPPAGARCTRRPPPARCSTSRCSRAASTSHGAASSPLAAARAQTTMRSPTPSRISWIPTAPCSPARAATQFRAACAPGALSSLAGSRSGSALRPPVAARRRQPKLWARSPLRDHRACAMFASDKPERAGRRPMTIASVQADHYRIPLPVALSDSTHGTMEASSWSLCACAMRTAPRVRLHLHGGRGRRRHSRPDRARPRRRCWRARTPTGSRRCGSGSGGRCTTSAAAASRSSPSRQSTSRCGT